MCRGGEYLPVAVVRDTLNFPRSTSRVGNAFGSTPRSIYRMLLESIPRRSGIGSDPSRVNASIGLQDASRVNSSKKRYRIGFESTPRSVCRVLLESTPRRSGIGLDSSRVNTSIGLPDAPRINASRKRYRDWSLSSQRLDRLAGCFSSQFLEEAVSDWIPFESTPRSVCRMLLESTPRGSGSGLVPLAGFRPAYIPGGCLCSVRSRCAGHLFARSWCVRLFERFKRYTFITHAKGGSNSNNKAKIIVVVVIIVIYYIRDIFTLCTVLVTDFILSQHSCETALQWVISSWKREIGEGEMIGVIFLDLRRTFEVVDRETLIQKLEEFGLKEQF